MAGSIQKKVGPQGTSYLVRVEFPPDPVTGKRRQRSKAFKTRKEAEKALAQWLVEIERGTVVDGSKLTMADLFAQWLDVLRGTNPKPRTVIEYERTIRSHILPVLGATPVQKVHPAQLDALYAHLRGRGASADAVHRCHQRLGQAFDYAVRKRLLAVNPMLAVDAPKVRSAPPTILTVPQMQRFITTSTTDGYAPVWLLILQTGLRRGEALGLRWCDIDWERRRLRVRQGVEVLHGAAHLTTPKTPAALRTVSLFPESVAALAEHRKRQVARQLAAGPEWRDLDLVFTTPTGGPLNPNNVLRNLCKIIKKANAPRDGAIVPPADVLPRFDIHDLRHTHATHLLMDGWSVAIVSRRLGHANPAITLQLYAHAISDVQGDEVLTPAAFAFAGTA